MIGEKLIVVVSIIFGGIVLLAVGYFVGIGFTTQNQKIISDCEEPQQITKTVGAISSKMIQSIVAFGKVSNISDRTIVITDGEENMSIYVKEDIQISSFILATADKGGTSSTTSKQIKVEFSDIKIGDQVSTTIKILPDNKIEAVSVIIIPAFDK
ncbi:MAG: hypothetical protein Q8O66_04000 [bacterium]|nr:hypothetical protein [bacterium]